MSKRSIKISDAMKDPVSTGAVQDIVSLFRRALEPRLYSNPADIPRQQGFIITAAALMAGITVGHMIARGTLKDSDKRNLVEIVLRNFRQGIEFGKAEARTAMLAQTAPQGTA